MVVTEFAGVLGVPQEGKLLSPCGLEVETVCAGPVRQDGPLTALCPASPPGLAGWGSSPYFPCPPVVRRLLLRGFLPFVFLLVPFPPVSVTANLLERIPH